MKYQLKATPAKKAQFDKCQTNQEKREFYYNVFLLDPNASQKSARKECLERQTTTNTQAAGRTTKPETGKPQGARPEHPEFESLCNQAVEGLEDFMRSKLGLPLV